MRIPFSILLPLASSCLGSAAQGMPESHGRTDADATTVFMRDAGWCWFQDPRTIIAGDKLVVGGVSGRTGDIKVSVFDLTTSEPLGEVVLNKGFERDDHDTPAFYLRPDGRILAVYAKHTKERFHYYRISEPGNPLEWSRERTFEHQYDGRKGVTYMNLAYLRGDGRLYNFFRDGLTFNPSLITSDDHGSTWGSRTHFIVDELGWDRPYVRYFQLDADTVAFSFTDAHPRNFGNNLYYAEFRSGAFHHPDGTLIGKLSDGPIKPSQASRIYQGSETRDKPEGYESVPNSAWASSMSADRGGRPHLGYSVYLSDEDHRYRLASWSGTKWIDREVAHAGSCLYPSESSYTGLITLDPSDASFVVISTDVDPETGRQNGGQFEIYSATIGAGDHVGNIDWHPITERSDSRNIRPVIVATGGYKVLLWMRGEYTTYADYRCDLVGRVLATPGGTNKPSEP